MLLVPRDARGRRRVQNSPADILRSYDSATDIYVARPRPPPWLHSACLYLFRAYLFVFAFAFE